MKKIAVIFWVLWLLSSLAVGQQLQPGHEPIPNTEVFRSSVRAVAGYPLEVFLTRPKGVKGRLPVLFEVAWLSCDSVEQPKGVEDGFTQLVWDLAGRSGFATFRLDKPGVGDSGGPSTPSHERRSHEGCVRYLSVAGGVAWGLSFCTSKSDIL